jgi:adenosyl cobinamide kinase/adenosyl cobinamide phosphate guanylyltransferase
MWIKVHDSLDPNLKSLAIQLLSGDESAYRPMLDAAMENVTGKGERITPQYVEALEDELREIRKVLLFSKEVGDALALYDEDTQEFFERYSTLERHARQLNRQGLS